MLDTIILQIPQNDFNIPNKDVFHLIASKKSKDGIRIFAKYANNPTAEDEHQNIYKPRLTVVETIRGTTLKIEFSAAKILYKNNLQEPTEAQFVEVVRTLKKLIAEMGVYINENILINAAVVAFHPAKNIPIIGGYSAMMIIKEFAKINLTEKMEFDHKDYRNGGHGLQLRAQAHALTFYDKVLDLTKTEKKSFGKDQKMQQLSLLDYKERINKLEILRMEVRLNDKRKIRAVLSSLNLPPSPTFEEIFKKDVCQKILLNYFTTYIDPNLFIFDFEETAQKILTSLIAKKPTIKPAAILQLIGLKMLCKDDGGVRGLRRIFGKKLGKRNWQRIAEKIKLLNKTVTIDNCHDYVKQIKAALQKFEPYTLPPAKPKG